MKRVLMAAVLGAATWLAGSGPAEAGTIVGVATFQGNGNSLNSSSIGATTVDLSKTMNTFNTADLVFNVLNTGTSTTYTFTETLLNNTGATWTGYVLTASGVGTFDTAVASSVFTTSMVTPTRIDLGGGTVASGQGLTLTFSVDIGDSGPVGSISTFTLRQTGVVGISAVPEPASATLLGLGGAALAATGLRRRLRRRV